MMKLAQEEWKKISGFERYSVSSHGRVRRDSVLFRPNGAIENGKLLTPSALPSGHLKVRLCVNYIRRDFLVHRLVAVAFLAPPSCKFDCVLHIDDDPSNNRADNLFWGTRQINSQDMCRKGRQARGDKLWSAKIDASTIEEIRRTYQSGSETQREIASRFGISQSNVSQIVNNKTWRHI